MKKIGDISIIIGTIIGIGYIFVGLSWFSAERDFTSPDVLEYIATYGYPPDGLAWSVIGAGMIMIIVSLICSPLLLIIGIYAALKIFREDNLRRYLSVGVAVMPIATFLLCYLLHLPLFTVTLIFFPATFLIMLVLISALYKGDAATKLSVAAILISITSFSGLYFALQGIRIPLPLTYFGLFLCIMPGLSIIISGIFLITSGWFVFQISRNRMKLVLIVFVVAVVLTILILFAGMNYITGMNISHINIGIDDEHHHLGDNFKPDLFPQNPEGTSYTTQITISDQFRITTGNVTLSIVTKNVIPTDTEGIGLYYDYVYINEHSIGKLNNFIQAEKQDYFPRTVDIPFSASLLNTGRNTITITSGCDDSGINYDDFEFYDIKLEIVSV